MGRSVSWRQRLALFAVCLASVVFIACGAPRAFGDTLPPAVTGVSPANGTAVPGPFTLSAHLSDLDGLASTASVTVDGGATYPATFTYAEVWYDDGCSAWSETDYTNADISCAVPDLAQGPHTLTINSRDAVGNAGAYSTTVVRNGALTFSNQLPAPDNRVRSVTSVSARVSGGTIDTGTVVMKIDGTPVVPTVTPGGSTITTISYATTTLGVGTHTVYVSASSGGVPSATTWSFTIDTTPPAVTYLSPSANAMLSVAGTTIYATISDMDGRASSTLYLDGAAVPATPVDYGSYWTYSYTVSALSEGTHTIRIDATDRLGNSSTYTSTFRVAEPPRFGTVSPTGWVGGRPTITAAFTDGNDGVTSAQATFDGLPVASLLTTASGGRSGSVAVLPLLPLTDGAHTVLVKAWDAAGNMGQTSWSFYVDTTGPALSGLSPASGANVTGAFTFSAHATDAIGVNDTSAWLAIDGVSYPLACTFPTEWVDDGCSAYWVTDYTNLDMTAQVPALATGTHTVALSVADTAGNVSTSTYTISNGAVMAFASKLPAPSTTTGPATHIEVKVGSVNVNAATLVMKVDGAAVPATWTPPASGSTTGTLAADRQLANGSHTVSVSASDTAGNSGQTSWSFTVDAIAPVITPLTPSPNTTTSVLAPTMSAKITDASGIPTASVTLKVDGAPRTYTASGSATTMTLSAVAPSLGNGSHTISVTATDTYGNVATGSWSFVVRDLPAFGTPTPGNGSTVPGAVSQVSLPVSTVNAVLDPASARVVVDGVVVPSSMTLSDGKHGTVVGTVAIGSSGTHSVSVTVADVDGDSATSSWSFTTSNLGPAISVSPANNATVTVPFAIYMHGSDPGQMDPNSGRLSIDGGATMTIPGDYDSTWYDDGCGGYYEYDYTGAGFWYNISSLSFGTHTFRFSCANAAGVTSSYTWTLTRVPQVLWSAQTPAANSKRNSVTRVSVNLTGARIETSSVTMKLDGSAVTPSFTLPATEDATGSIWLDRDLAQGTHTVSVTAKDISGGATSTTTWSFLVDKTPPTVTVVSPSSATTVTDSLTRVYATLVDNDSLYTLSLALYADGTKATNASVSSLTATSANVYLPIYALSEGDHTFRVDGTDQAGNTVSQSWQVRVEDPPRFESLIPGAGATDIPRGDVRLTVWDANDAIATDSITAVVDGRQLTPTVSQASSNPVKWLVTIPTGALRLSTHEATVTARDASGHVRTQAWSFKIAQQPMTVGDCSSCHNWSAHPALNCATCHGSDCGSCHGAHTDCYTCHGDGHDQSTLTAGHTSTASLSCYTCHDRDITFEHSGRVSSSGAPIQCTTCHNSTSPQVKAAITNRDASCTACHPSVDHDTVHNVPTIADCASCHASSLTIIHVGKPATGGALMTCDTCHNPASDTVWNAVQGGRTDCTACHTESSHRVQHDSALSPSCASCHNSNLIDQHTNGCASCHSSTDPKVTAAIANGKTDCVDCHDSADSSNGEAHPAIHTRNLPAPDCSGCHDPNLVSEHSKTTSSSSARGCDACHPSPRSSINGPWDASCATGGCHASGTSQAMHGGIDAKHARGSDTTACAGAGCHNDDLAVTHKDATATIDGAAVSGCLVCHGRDRMPTSGLCTACHTGNPHPQAHTTTGVSGTVVLFSAGHDNAPVPTTVQVDCGLCHEVGDISALHGNTCSTCHPGPRDSFTSWTGGCQQGGCHTTIHAKADAGHKAVFAQGYSDGGCACHDTFTFNVSVANCGYCHTLTDHTAPATSSDATAAYVGSAAIHLSASDRPAPGGSGVAHTYYRIDGGERAEGVTVKVGQPASGSAAHTIEYWSADGAANEETPHRTASFTIASDMQPPVTTSNARTSYEGPATIRLAVTDNGTVPATSHYRIDGGATATGSVISLPQPSGTEQHTVEFWSVDEAGNTEATHSASFTMIPDVTPPVTVSNAVPFYQGGSQGSIITLTATDTGSGVKGTSYRLDSGPVITSTCVLVNSTLSAGDHTLEFWSLDAVGNAETHRSVTFTVDRTPPRTTSDAQISYSGPATIRLSSADDTRGAGVGATYYKVDGGAQTNGTVVTVPGAGNHILEFWSVDAVGNAETPHNTASFSVGYPDATPPTTSCDATGSYIATATIRLTATDDEGGSGVAATYYKLDGGSQIANTTFSVSTIGTHTVEYWSVDNAGNVEQRRTATFKVVAPTGTGTIQFAWDDLPEGSWTYYYVYEMYDSQGHLLASGFNETGWFIVNVPVSPTPYQLKAYWYCPDDPGYPVWSYGSALIDYPGKVVTWRY